MSSFSDALERVINQVVRPDAPSIDAEGTFPRRGIDALSEAGLSDAVREALVILAAGEWSSEAIGHGWALVAKLEQEMDEGRRRRLVRLGFADREAAELSSLHTRNLM